MQHIVAQVLHKLNERVASKVLINACLILLFEIRGCVLGPHMVTCVLY